MPALQLCLASPDQCPEKSTNASQYLHHIISLTCSKPATVPHRSAFSLCMFEDKKNNAEDLLGFQHEANYSNQFFRGHKRGSGLKLCQQKGNGEWY